MGWELRIIRTESWFDNSSNPISNEKWLKITHDDEELLIYKNNGDFYAIWSGHSERLCCTSTIIYSTKPLLGSTIPQTPVSSAEQFYLLAA